MDAWMWPLKDEIELAQSVEQPLLFINMEAFQTAPNLKAMKRFTVDADHTERRVVTLKYIDRFDESHLACLTSIFLQFLFYFLTTTEEASTRIKSTYHFYCRCT